MTVYVGLSTGYGDAIIWIISNVELHIRLNILIEENQTSHSISDHEELKMLLHKHILQSSYTTDVHIGRLLFFFKRNTLAQHKLEF